MIEDCINVLIKVCYDHNDHGPTPKKLTGKKRKNNGNVYEVSRDDLVWVVIMNFLLSLNGNKNNRSKKARADRRPGNENRKTNYCNIKCNFCKKNLDISNGDIGKRLEKINSARRNPNRKDLRVKKGLRLR